MGPVESSPRAFMRDPYYVIDAGGSNDGVINVKPSVSSLVVANKMTKNAFNGIWSMNPSNSLTPEPRTSQFSVSDEKRKCSIIGYGLNHNDNLLNDVWAVSHANRKWSRISIDPNAVSPRNGTTAVMIDNQIWLFGGFQKGAYLQDLHVIDLNNFKVVRPQTTGVEPPARVGHVMVSYGRRIYVWGGYNGDWLSSFFVLDVDSLQWREVETNIRGRTSTSFCVKNESVYIFGCSRSDALLRFDLKTEVFEVVKTTGSEPCPELTGSSMVSVDKYLLIVGGKKQDRSYQLIHAFDSERKWWFVFHIVPDGETVNMSDGYVTKDGLFLTPVVSGATSYYYEERREIVIFMGTPIIDPLLFFCINVGEALGFLHMQNDMICLLK